MKFTILIIDDEKTYAKGLLQILNSKNTMSKQQPVVKKDSNSLNEGT